MDRMIAFDRSDGRTVVRVRVPRLLPAETLDHLQAAQRELLLAVRSVLDAAIERSEQASRSGQRQGRVESQVE